MKLVNQDQFSMDDFPFHFFANVAAFSGANFARIPHAARFVSSAALVRRGLDHLS